MSKLTLLLGPVLGVLVGGVLLAQSEERRGDLETVADLTRILEMNPRDFTARFNRGLAYEALREYEKAIADYTQVIEGGTDFSGFGAGKEKGLAHAHHYRGRAYQWYKQDPAKAVFDYTDALRLDPDIEMVRYRRGQANNTLKQYANAAVDFDAALQRDPDYPNLLCAYAWQLATCPDARFRDGKKSLELAEKANLKFNWKVPEHVETLAAAYAEAGRFDEAAQWQKNAMELFASKAKASPRVERAMKGRLKQYEMSKPHRAE